jgi:hypothetical protein
VLAGLAVVVALLLAGVVSYYASSSPDGLTRVADDQGISRAEKPHATDDSPLAGYSVRGVGDDRLARGLAGVAGVGVVLVLGTGLTRLVRRSSQGPHGPREDAPSGVQS